MTVIQELEKAEIDSVLAKRGVPEFEAGDTIRVHVRVTEGTRTRVQAYEGVCIARKGGGLNESFTVRKISYGEGVERVFQVYSPMIEQIEVVRRGSVRRAKLYYLRGRRGKSARIAESTTIRTKRLNDADRQSAASARASAEAEKVATRKAAEDAKAAEAEAEAAEAAAEEAAAEEAKTAEATAE